VEGGELGGGEHGGLSAAIADSKRNAGILHFVQNDNSKR
jgi:hypothetical protein